MDEIYDLLLSIANAGALGDSQRVKECAARALEEIRRVRDNSWSHGFKCGVASMARQAENTSIPAKR